MFSKPLTRHGHGHGHEHHRKMHRHGGKHEQFGHHFKHPGHHMGKEFFKRKHHRGLDFERVCFSESELPDATTQNVEAGAQDACKFVWPRNFHMRKHHWICERCCGKNIAPDATNDENKKNDEEGNPADMSAEMAETAETTNPNTSAQNKVGDKTECCGYKGWHYFRSHGGRRHEFKGSCPRCAQKDGDTTENEPTTDGEKEENTKERFVGKRYEWHHKGRKGHGHRKCCQEESGTETEDLTGDERGVKHGHIRKHRFGHGHHGGRRGYEFGARMFEERHHHGGKWHHGPHGRHHGGWRRHECCIVMVDASVNTGEPESEGAVIQEVRSQENSATGQNMEQDRTEEVGQEQVEPENDQVLEVANNLEKSSLE